MQREKPIMTYNPKKILNVDVELGDRFCVLEKIGQGSFGDIYKVFDKQKNQLGAVKLERKDKKSPMGMLLKEAQIIYDLRNSEYFPKLIEASQHKEYNYLIMQFLGPNLENIKRKQNNQMSLKTVLLIGIQMIQDLENLHNHKYIHRDIKPENFVIGTDGNHHNVYLIDFGLSKKYLDDSGKHIPFSENKGLVGTARYTSINSHIGTEQSRRDDLEGLGYILIYFVKKQLPWQNLNCQNRNEKFKKIQQYKVKTSLPDLCENLPSEFVEYFKHVKSLAFTQKPDYSYLKGLFLKVLQKNYSKEKFCYDWCKSDCPINMNSQIKQAVIECRKNTKFDLEILQNKVDTQIYSSMFLSQSSNAKKTTTQSLKSKAESAQTQQNLLENTDFTDIEERKKGENQIKLPYIDKTYSVRMSLMNNSQINNFQKFCKTTKNSTTNFASIGHSQFYPPSNSDSKILFYGADTSNANLVGYNSTRISKLNFDKDKDNNNNNSFFKNLDNDSKNPKILQSNILNSNNILSTKYQQIESPKKENNSISKLNGKNLHKQNSFSNEMDIQDENQAVQQLYSNNHSRLELAGKKYTNNQQLNINNQSLNVNLGSFANNFNNPNSKYNSQSNINQKPSYSNQYQQQYQQQQQQQTSQQLQEQA